MLCLPSQDPAALSRFSIADLLPDLQHIIFWMANAIEILYFVQQKSPTYIQSMEEELDIKGKSGCSILPVFPAGATQLC